MPKHPYHELFKGDLVDDDGNLGPIGQELADALPSSGGSSGEVEIVMPFAFDDADILTGIDIYAYALATGQYVPQAGDRLRPGTSLSVTTVFDGTTPTLYLVFEGASPGADALAQADATTLDGDHDSLGHLKVPAASLQDTDNYLGDATPITLLLDDGAGGDPNAPTPLTQGAGEARLIVLPKGGA